MFRNVSAHKPWSFKLEYKNKLTHTANADRIGQEKIRNSSKKAINVLRIEALITVYQSYTKALIDEACPEPCRGATPRIL